MVAGVFAVPAAAAAVAVFHNDDENVAPNSNSNSNPHSSHPSWYISSVCEPVAEAGSCAGMVDGAGNSGAIFGGTVGKAVALWLP